MENKKRLIDFNEIKLKAFADPDSGEAIVYLQDIDEMPTVDAVEVVHGQKRKAFAYSIVVDRQCSLCAAYMSFNDNYCPHCGAKLDLEEPR